MAAIGVDEAFKPAVTFRDGQFHVRIEMAEHIHLSQDGLKFAVEPKGRAALGTYTLPEPEKDEFGDPVYNRHFEVDIPLRQKASDLQAVTFVLTYQGCSDRGICYPPVTKRYRFDLPAFEPNGEAV